MSTDDPLRFIGITIPSASLKSAERSQVRLTLLPSVNSSWASSQVKAEFLGNPVPTRMEDSPTSRLLYGVGTPEEDLVDVTTAFDGVRRRFRMRQAYCAVVTVGNGSDVEASLIIPRTAFNELSYHWQAYVDDPTPGSVTGKLMDHTPTQEQKETILRLLGSWTPQSEAFAMLSFPEFGELFESPARISLKPQISLLIPLEDDTHTNDLVKLITLEPPIILTPREPTQDFHGATRWYLPHLPVTEEPTASTNQVSRRRRLVSLLTGSRLRSSS